MNLTFDKSSSIRKQLNSGNWQTTLDDTYINNITQSAQLIDYIDLQSHLKPIDIRQWQHIADKSLEHNLRSPKLLLKLSHLLLDGITCTDLSDKERKVILHEFIDATAKMPWLNYSDIVKTGYLGSALSHYPALLARSNLPHSLQKCKCVYSKSLMYKSTQLQNLSMQFDKAVDMAIYANGARRRNITCAIVGNSPSLLERKEGKIIDSADIVVRFNNVDLEKKEYTGTKTNIWVMSPSFTVHRCPDKASIVIISGFTPLQRASFFWRALPDLSRPICQFPTFVWYELVKKLNAPPSAGVLLVASLKHHFQNLQIHCYGMTSQSHLHNSQRNHFADSRSRSTRHNWYKEADWLHENLKI